MHFVLKLLISIIGIFSTGFLLIPAKGIAILVSLICGFSVSVIFVLFHRRIFMLEDHGRVYSRILPFALIASIIMMRYFYLTWLPSSKISELARRLGLSSRILLIIIAAVLGAFSAYFLSVVLARVKVLLTEKFSTCRLWNCAGKYCVIIIISIVQFIQIENSALYGYNAIAGRNVLIAFINVWVVLTINLLVVLIAQSWRVSLIISSSLFLIWSIADYYTVIFHGSPLFFSELVNIKTAAEVIGGYHFPFDINVIFIIILFCFNLFFSITYIPRKRDMKFLKRLIIRSVALAISLIALYFLSGPIFKKDEAWISWQDSVARIGFLMCTLEDIQEQRNTIKMPEGYSADSLNDCVNPELVSNPSPPDIILILNESFYDLEIYTEINADVDYTADFYNIPGAKYGYAVAPDIGGGTNNSEYELLTSKSMMLLQHAPFTYLDQSLLRRSIVGFLDDLGYATTGMHCGNENNYSRNTAYPAIGFSEIMLGRDSFSYYTMNGNRRWLDTDNYKDLIEIYKDAGDGPRFMFLLTLQNHGGYEQNNGSLDTVHTQNDFGELTDEVNEFLSSIQLSCQAFKELTNYYSKGDRDVIICMVGDHAPSFVSSLPANKESEIDEEGINMRCVPYVIWSNFDAGLSDMYTDYVSMVDLVPMVLHAAGLPLSSFYQEILNLHEILPIRTSYGQYVDRDFIIGNYEPSDKYYDQMKLYYYLEYNSLLEGDEYREELFAPTVD